MATNFIIKILLFYIKKATSILLGLLFILRKIRIFKDKIAFSQTKSRFFAG